MKGVTELSIRLTLALVIGCSMGWLMGYFQSTIMEIFK